MIVHVEAGGKTHAVEVRRANGRFVVTIDGRERSVDVIEGGGTLSLIIGTRTHEIFIAEGPDGAMMVHVDGHPVPVSVQPSRPSWRSRAGASHGDDQAAGPQRIAAPMPGKIVKVLVKPGDAVEARRGLIVVEAMKMENELRAPKAGTVAEVRVQEGASVEAGAILVVLE